LCIDLPDERIVRGYHERVSRSRVHPQDRAEQVGQRLASSLGVVARSPVSQAKVEKAVGSKRQLTAVVIGERLICGQKHQLAYRVGAIGISRDEEA
jgi:hypothetical protein